MRPISLHLTCFLRQKSEDGLVDELIIADEIVKAVTGGKAVVALESAVIAAGLPSPYNLDAARRCESAIREQGALPATIAIIEGEPKIGCSKKEIDALGGREDVLKTNLSNLCGVVAKRQWGATTVSTTMHLASAAGIRVFSTGGIGGVHRDAERSFDISSDLIALQRYPVIAVCAGAKSILDLPRTVEALETLGVPVVGYQTDEFPSFYSRESGIKLDIVAESPDEAAAIARKHWALGFKTAVLVAAPIPKEHEIPFSEIESICRAAIEEANREEISGKAVTPYLLGKLDSMTGGRAVSANIALLENNARTAAMIACALSDII